MKLFSAIPAVSATASAVRAEAQVVIANGEVQSLAPINVAIIGAGAAGSSASYHLAQYAASAGFPVNITVFDRNDYIGGRSTTINAYNDTHYPVELGASIFVEVNQILVNAVKDFNLSMAGMIAGTSDIPGAAIGVWDGKQFVLTQDTESATWWDTARMLWKYGLAPIRTMQLMKSTVGKFLTMYEEPQFPFASLTEAVHSVGLLDATSSTGEQYILANKITGPFGHDVIQASTRVNYAQNLNYINGLLSMVCMATDGAMSVAGGNWQIFDRMVSAANATTVLGMQVSVMKRQQGGQYVLTYGPATDSTSLDVRAQSFDTIVLAAPYQYANISLTSDLKRVPDKIPYVELHVTLFTSPHLLSPAFFNMQPGKAAPKVVLTTLLPHERPHEGPAGVGTPGFFSISMLAPITNPQTAGQEYLYKIFSPSPPNSTLLTHLLGLKQPRDHQAAKISEKDITWIYRKVWNSYPYELPRVTFEEIQLDENVWYTSGMEGFISTMETSALAGMNVARLIVDQFREKQSNASMGNAIRE